MNILAIETSCDETAAAVVKNGRTILSSSILSQIKIHKKYMGVVPELASRAHVEFINLVLDQAIKPLKVPIQAIAVTVGPGLTGSLLVGRMVAETLGWAWKIPVLGINHIEGHLLSTFLSHKGLKPPFVGLVVSGGHSEIIYAPKLGQFELVGRTRDDAAGEAFDKVAKMLKLGYPGGPIIDRLAKGIDPQRIPFPIPWLPGSWDFSFSGLKTAVLYKLREKKNWSRKEIRYLSAGFQRSVVEVLVGKTLQAAAVLNCSTVVVGGGVAANTELRNRFKAEGKSKNLKVCLAPAQFCTDNAAMIGAAAFFKLNRKRKIFKNSLRIEPYAAFQVTKTKLKPFAIPSN